MDPLYKVTDGNRRCPYNPSHQVQAVRFIGHLLKCAKRSSFKLSVCPWNATHHVHPEDYQQHLTTCESQELLDGIGEIARPDSAYVREYKERQRLMMEPPKVEEEIIEYNGKAILLQEPVNINHDYSIELYNQRFQTQMFCTRDIDEMDAPPMNTNVQFDHRGNPCYPTKISEKAEANNGQFDDSSDDFHCRNGERNGEASGSIANNHRLDNISDDDDGSADRIKRLLEEKAARPLPVSDESIDYVTDNDRYYYGQRLVHPSNGHSDGIIAVDSSCEVRSSRVSLALRNGEPKHSIHTTCEVAKPLTNGKIDAAPEGAFSAQNISIMGRGRGEAIKRMFGTMPLKSGSAGTLESVRAEAMCMRPVPTRSYEETPKSVFASITSTNPRSVSNINMRAKPSSISEELPSAVRAMTRAQVISFQEPTRAMSALTVNHNMPSPTSEELPRPMGAETMKPKPFITLEDIAKSMAAARQDPAKPFITFGDVAKTMGAVRQDPATEFEIDSRLLGARGIGRGAYLRQQFEQIQIGKHGAMRVQRAQPDARCGGRGLHLCGDRYLIPYGWYGSNTQRPGLIACSISGAKPHPDV